MPSRLSPLFTVAALAVAGMLVAPATPAHAADAAGAADAAWSVGTANGEHGSDRPNFQLDAKPGAVVRDRVVIANTGSTALDLRLYAADAYTTPAGLLDLKLADQRATDLGAWVTIDKKKLHLAPGARAAVPFEVAVPKDARPGDHSGGIVTSLVTTAQGSPLTVDRRLGIRVQLRVAGKLAPASTVDHVRVSFAQPWNPFAAGALTVSYDLRNTGNTRIAATDSLAVAGLLGMGAAAQGPEQVPEVLPGSSVHVERTLPAVAALGWLTGSLEVSPAVAGRGQTTIEPISTAISVPAVPWVLLVLVVAAAAAAVAIVLIVRRRRSRPAS